MKVGIERLELSKYLPLNFEHLNLEPLEGSIVLNGSAAITIG